jgi:chromate transporter
MTFLLLFLEFLQTGLFSVGGGYATLHVLAKDHERYPDWFGRSSSPISPPLQNTPGPVGVNAQRLQATARRAFPAH